jgi:hypothetical protein
MLCDKLPAGRIRDRFTGIAGYAPACSSEVFPLATGPLKIVSRFIIHRSTINAVSALRPKKNA